MGLTELAGCRALELTHNHKTTIPGDALRWFLSCKFGRNSDAVAELQRNWEHFAETAPPCATYLQIAYSEGVTNLRNALRNCSPELRERI